ncbi:threonine/homoserine/homoserine lactone efflux protein [Motilibacter rhizosphaerae]|uniref:Threonine/homoserine/homoserine lactone efflux protein n=1 Tax=Motilibacter rhizosphaerae TaxID=598652 RepID=A0A4Q7NB12_9ACTN|nr:LysE family translocator [Motilibacter rhizosphaerae]RZS80000.1 threonine/homoserine/homoserine lactone efflux protein [Motilibacter rhizosphaerae]
MLVTLASFLVASVLIVLLPGPDTLVVVRGLVRGGRRGGALTAAGVLCGVVVWVAAASLGLSALLQASEVGYDALKVAGAVYLLWLGVQSLRSIRRTPAEVAETGDGPTAPSAALGRSGFVAGFLTDILNPKVGVFFVSFLPGFVPHGWSVGWTTMGLGGVFAVLTAAYFAGLVAVSGTIATWMQTPRIRRRLDVLSGVVLIGFGVRLAAER